MELEEEMNTAREKRKQRLSRKARVRKKVRGTAERPRLSVYRSLSHIYAQLIDDEAGKTLASVSSLRLELPAVDDAGTDEGDKKKKKRPEGVKVRRSRAVGKAIAEKAVSLGIRKVVFDRGGFLYHGRVAALAESARKNGLEF